MSVDLTSLTISELLSGYEKREFSPVDVITSYLDVIERSNEALNVYVNITSDSALKSAEESSKRWEQGEAGALEGIPIAVKDLFATRGVHTQACSKILDGFLPTYESTVTSNLWSSGAIMLGKTNMDEFAMGSSNEHTIYGPAKNPWRVGNVDYVPGGSSGGSAAAVAGDLCAAATGTDTGGSIRQPAAFTGTVGIKPTYGRCSRYGIVAFASSLDQAGPLTKDVRDSALMLNVMASSDVKDTTCVDLPVPDYASAIDESVKGMKIGIPSEYRVDGMREIEDLWDRGISMMRSAGVKIDDTIHLPHTHYALPAYYIVAPAEASSNLARYDGVRYGLREESSSIDEMYERTRAAGFGDEVKRRILIGTYALSAGYYDAYYLHAQKVRTLVKRDFEKVFASGIDAILVPTTPTPAFAIGDESMADPLKMYFNDVFTVTANMAGLPAISVPAGLSSDGLPLGLQLISAPFCEETLFKLGHIIEDSVGRLCPEKWWLR